MNKKINELKRKWLVNLISFFIEFFLLSTIFTSSVNGNNLYSLIIKIFDGVSKEFLLSSSLALIILSTSIRVIYARYLDNKIDFLEKEIIKNENMQKIKENNIPKYKIKENSDKNIIVNKKYKEYNSETIENNKLNFFNSRLLDNNEDKSEKVLVKVYKK